MDKIKIPTEIVAKNEPKLLPKEPKSNPPPVATTAIEEPSCDSISLTPLMKFVANKLKRGRLVLSGVCMAFSMVIQGIEF